MAKIERNNFDLPTLAIKGKLIGTELALEDGTFLEISDWYIDWATFEMHIDFIDNTGGVYNMREKHTVLIEDVYKKVSKKDRKKKAKRKN